MDGAAVIGRTGCYPSTLHTKGTDRSTKARTFERFSAVVGGRIREARLGCGWSVFDLARHADVPASVIRSAEVGDAPSLRVLCQLAQAMGVDARELMP